MEVTPCQEVIQQLSSLSNIVKGVDKKIKELELDVDMIGKYTGRQEDASEASIQMLEDTRQLVETARSGNEELRVLNRNFEEFLVDIVGQMKNLSAECTEMEEYMAQYGYQIPSALDPACFDIFARAAPAAAADMPAAGTTDVPADQPSPGSDSADLPASDDNVASEQQQKSTAVGNRAGGSEGYKSGGQIGQFDVPSIFDIGLSAETLMRLAGVNIAKEVAVPVYSSAKKYIDSVKKSAAKRQPVEAAVPADKLQRLQLESFLEEEVTYQASPILKLSRLLDVQTLESPFVPHQKSAEELNEPVEISPDLYTRRQSNKRKTPATPTMRATVKNDGTPQTPELQTVNLRALLSKHGERREEASAKQGVNKDNKNSDDNIPTPEFLSLDLHHPKKEKVVLDVDTPELLTMDLNRLVAQKMGTRSPVTPDLENTY